MTPQQIDAMKLALGQLQAGFVGNAMQILREALAEHAMQEVQRLGQEIEQAPVAFASHGVINWIADKQFQHEADLYTAPPQRKPLTDEQYFEIGQRHWLSSSKVEQIHKELEEAAHGIKENT